MGKLQPLSGVLLVAVYQHVEVPVRVSVIMMSSVIRRKHAAKVHDCLFLLTIGLKIHVRTKRVL